jgi:hypothetical protein
METVLENNTRIMIEIIQSSDPQISVLRLTNYSETATGHYWCTVNTTQPGQEAPYPSHVINIIICPFSSKTGSEGCSTEMVLFQDPMGMERCADVAPTTEDIIIIEEEQLGSKDLCAIKNHDRDVEESTATVTDETSFPPSTSPDQSTNSPNSGFPMRYVWMIVGIAFGALIIIIVIMLATIIYLNHKKNKIKGKAIFRSMCINRSCMT